MIVINHTWITMPDGARLGARIWLPDNHKEKPAAAILEYIPYRKDDYSAVRDSTTIAWFAEHGYACVRVDMRGSGSSDGIMEDEYTEQEISDGVSVIEWMASQSWCNGHIGMMGISWGGISAMQVAQRNPAALKTIIVLGATEFRYYDDGSYYMGGMVGQTIGWAAIMFGYNTRPPDPALQGDHWRDLWLKRLNETPHYLEHWLAHQREDDYWLRGSAGTDYSAIQIPVYAVSGHADCWPNTVSRLIENLSVPRRGLQGPWCHRYPHLGIPGPAVGFLSDAKRWFDQWLSHKDTGILQESTYQLYIQDSVPPQPFYAHRPGRWVGEPDWPSPNIENKPIFLGENQLSWSPNDASVLEISSPQSVGLMGGEYMPWFAFGPADELPDNQEQEDLDSLCFDIEVTEEELVIAGNPLLDLTVSCNQPIGLIAARLCDVRPDGRSTMITRGILNLCQRDGKDKPLPLTPGEQYSIQITLNHVGYAVPHGHRLRLALSTSYWPIAWPTPFDSRISIYTSGSKLLLPLRNMTSALGNLTEFEQSTQSSPLATTQQRPFHQRRERYTDRKTGCEVLEIDVDNGAVKFSDNTLEMASTNLQRYSIHPDDPLSARVEHEWNWQYQRTDKWNIHTFARTELTCDRDYFFLKAVIFAYENDIEVFHGEWDKRYLRDCF